MEEVNGLWKCTGSVCVFILFIGSPGHTLGHRIPGLLAIIHPELQWLCLSKKIMKHKGKELQDKAGVFCQSILNISVHCSCYICIPSCKYIYKINNYSSCRCLLINRAMHHFWIKSMVVHEYYLETCVCSFAVEKSQSMGTWVMNWRSIHVSCHMSGCVY